MSLSAPDTSAEKIVIGQTLPTNLMDLDYGVEKNINIIEAKNKKINELKACIKATTTRSYKISSKQKLSVKINYIVW